MSWLKFDLTTPEKPEVFAITAALGYEDPDLTVGKLLKVWRWFDQHTENGDAPSVTPALLDRLIGVTGMTQAMLDVGWMEEIDGGLRVPHFERHNGASAKKRALNKDRNEKFRNRVNSEESRDAKRDAKRDARSVTEASLEKRREEKRRDTVFDSNTATTAKPKRARSKLAEPIERPGGVSEQVWADFLSHRAAKRAPVSATVIDGIQREANIAGMTLERALATCCERGWQGFKAEWLREDSPINGARRGRQMTTEEYNAAAAEQWLAGSGGAFYPPNDGRTIDG